MLDEILAPGTFQRSFFNVAMRAKHGYHMCICPWELNHYSSYCGEFHCIEISRNKLN